MPSTSQKQHDFWEAAYHNPDFRKKAGVSKSVAKDYLDADKKEGKYQSQSQSQPAPNGVRTIIGYTNQK